MTDIRQKIEQLRVELRKHNYNYYGLDSPVISDYDVKLKDPQELEDKHPEFFDPNSSTQRVGGQITKNINTITHKHRMYSIDNSYSREDILGWEIRIQIILGGVDFEKRPADSVATKDISNYPDCKTQLVRKEGDAKHYCPNEFGCPTQITGRIQHFISRKAMNIDGLGAEKVELLSENGLISNYADLYDLKKSELIPLERMAKELRKVD